MNTYQDDRKQSEESNPPNSKHTVGSIIDRVLEEHSVKLIAVVGLIILCFFMSWFFRNSEYSKINPPKIFSRAAVRLPAPSGVGSKQTSQNTKKPHPQWEPSAAQSLNTLNQQLKQAKADVAKTFPVTAPVKHNVVKQKITAVKKLAKKPKPLTNPPTLKQATKQSSELSSKHMAATSKYILQIMSSNNPTGLQRFIQAQHLQQRTRIITTQYKGKAWYILSYGGYQHYREAKQALRSLPIAVRKLHPWVRPRPATNQ